MSSRPANRSFDETFLVPRRQVLQQSASLVAIASLFQTIDAPFAAAADDYERLNRYPRMVHEFFVRQAREAAARHLTRLNAIQTKQDAEAYVQDARARIEQSFGPMPERTPLKARVTGTVDRDSYRIEKVVFESRPGFPVTANLYIPKGIDKPMPAVVGTCGHSHNGKAAEPYQAFAQGLARLGIICLIYDPIGQGERLQYVDDQLKPQMGVGVAEHLHAGNQQFLVGEFLGTWRAWDGIRALDYLLTRPEVDKQHVGVTGNSGGGTMTTWLCGLERRWTMAAPSCFVTTFRRNLENELPQDTEQCPPQALALGLDHADFLAAMAPRPVIILAKERDYFDVRGAEETYHRLRRLYRLLDAPDNVALFVGPTGHGYSQENREAMYSWFERASDRSSPNPIEALNGVLAHSGMMHFTGEPDIVIEKDATLQCTESGQVASLPSTRTVFDFTREKADALAVKRDALEEKGLQRAVREVLKLPESPTAPPDYRNWHHMRSRGYPSRAAMAYAVETEPGIQAIVYRLTDERWHSRPPRAGKHALLYVAHLSSDEELRNNAFLRAQIEADADVPVFTCDVRGIGESMPGTANPGSFHTAYGSDYFYAIHSIMLDRPYVGQKTFDLLRVLDWLASLGHTEVHLIGNGWGGLPATFAALLSDHVAQVTLRNALTSYTDLAASEHYDWPLSTILPDVLRHFDLPDCYAALGDKNLKQVEPWGPQMEKG